LFLPCPGAKGSREGVEGGREGRRKRKEERKLRKYIQKEEKGGVGVGGGGDKIMERRKGKE
jgi:hypothetical protein